jgi:hypothetical protein
VANEEQLRVLKKGTRAWNVRRSRHPRTKINLSQADLWKANLSGANLSNADLSEAILEDASVLLT